MGYVHDTQMSQYISPRLFHVVTGTWTQAAGAVTDTIAVHKAANAETSTVNIPVMIPSNAAGYKGAMLKSIEVDYELLLAAATSVTAVLNKVTRGADGAAATVSTVAFTQTPTVAVSDDQDQHKLVITLTTPEWVDNDCYYLLELSFECGGTVTIDLLGAVVNYTLRV